MLHRSLHGQRAVDEPGDHDVARPHPTSVNHQQSIPVTEPGLHGGAAHHGDSETPADTLLTDLIHAE